jgi:hypothetical protein
MSIPPGISTTTPVPVPHLRRATVRGVASALVFWGTLMTMVGLEAWQYRRENIEVEERRSQRGFGPYLAVRRIGPLTTAAIAAWTAALLTIPLAVGLWLIRRWAVLATAGLLAALAVATGFLWHYITSQLGWYPNKVLDIGDYPLALALGLGSGLGLAAIAAFLLMPGTRRLMSPGIRRLRGPSDARSRLARGLVGLIIFVAGTPPLFFAAAAMQELTRFLRYAHL